MQRLEIFIRRNRRFLPLSVTVLLFFAAYAIGALYLPGMRDPQVFFNLFNNTPYLLISVIGQTLVVISGGIDLSVGGVVALTTTASAALLRDGMNPWVVMLLMLLMGMAIGSIMGYFITYLKVQPFIATLAGMWFTRGMCYFITDLSISIDDPIYKLLAGTKILIPGLSDVVTKKGNFITPSVAIVMVFFLIVMYIAHFTRFGRTLYAIGGNNGANEQSARLMGLPVDRTKLLVYTFNGFCSALAGIALSIYSRSGHGSYAGGFELTVIAAVVIGGTMLTGGEGYVFGALFGALITVLIQVLIQFQGSLISWWTLIVVGLITLFFIGVQTFFANLKMGGTKKKETGNPQGRTRRALLWGGGVIAGMLLVLLILNTVQGGKAANAAPTVSSACKLQPFRQDEAASLMKAGAVITYERNGGATCIDELYSVYPDGRITGDNGKQKTEKKITPAEVEKLLADIDQLGWFTDNFYSTSHLPCSVCYTYFTGIAYKGKEKLVQAVDGGTDAPSAYWVMVGELTAQLPKFTSAP